MRPATARWLLDHTNVRSVLAARGRDADRETFTELLTLVKTATCDDGSSLAEDTNQQPRLEASGRQGFRTAEQAAAELGITGSAVRLAIRQHRLRADRIGSLYLITPDDLHEFRQRRNRT